MIKNWNLAQLRQKGMKYESAAAGLILIEEFETKNQSSPQRNATDTIHHSVPNT